MRKPTHGDRPSSRLAAVMTIAALSTALCGAVTAAPALADIPAFGIAPPVTATPQGTDPLQPSDTPGPNSEVDTIVVIRNPNSASTNATNLAVSSTLPTGAEFVGTPSFTPAGGGPNSIGTCVFTTTSFSCTGGVVGAFGNNITIHTRINLTKAYTSTTFAEPFSVAADTPSHQTPTVDVPTVNVVQGTDLSLMKTAAPATPPGCSAAQAAQAGATQPCVLHGQNVVYTLTVTNPPGGNPATTPTITDTLPAGQTFVATGSDPSCTASATNPVVVTCPRPTLAASSTDAITIIANTAGVSPPLPVTQTDTATVSSTTSDPDMTNNTATAMITVIPSADLSLTKSASPSPVVAGQQIIYTLTETNSGPDTAVNTKIVDTLPPGVTLATEGVVELVRNTIGGGVEVVGNAPGAAALAAAAGQASCTGATSGVVTTVTCLPGDLPSGQSRTVTIVAVAPTTAGPSTNVATVSSDTADPDPSNNTAMLVTTVSPACTDTRTNTTINHGLTVEPGTFLCLTNATVNGVVQIDAGAGLIETNATTGPVQGEAPAFVTICSSTVNGSVVVHDATGLVRVGDNKITCPPNRITGSVTLDYNHGGAAGPAIVGNRISGSLICKANVPVARDEGVTNPTSGSKLKECSGAAF